MGNEENEPFAFALCVGAGLATTIGAALAFCVDQNNNYIFALCLSVAAGVMTYVSFVEIFFKSRDEFTAWELEEGDANMAATVTFFFGLIVSIMLEHLTNMLFAGHTHKGCALEIAASPGPVGVPSADVNDVTLQAAQPEDLAKDQDADAAVGDKQQMTLRERANMLQMAAFSGVAIAAHNFPEGLATFVAAVEEPEFGVSMAIAIAIHNIPEGLAVAIPILKATNSKWKAFLWAFLSGLAEPIGAGLGWLVLREVIGPLVYALLFGVIGGVMVHISIRKLLPTAMKYDPENKVSSYGFFAGMAVMAASLVAFGY